MQRNDHLVLFLLIDGCSKVCLICSVFKKFMISRLASDLEALQGSLIGAFELYARDPVFSAEGNQPFVIILK